MNDTHGPSTSGPFFNSTNKNFNPLWVDSEITGKYVSPHLSFSKQKRFKWSSIYWPEDNDHLFALKRKRKSDVHQMANKVSKMIDQQQKNEQRIMQIKRTFSIGKNGGKKDAGNVLSTKKPFKLSKDNEDIVMRLTHFQGKKQSMLRDRHGNRCNMFEDPQADTDRQQVKNLYKTTGFKTSRKVKLQLPHNYYPGPGTYEIKRYLHDLDPLSTRIASSRHTQVQN